MILSERPSLVGHMQAVSKYITDRWLDPQPAPPASGAPQRYWGAR